MEKENKKSIKEQVLQKIESGQVAMHSRTYFLLRLAGLLLFCLAIIVVSVFIFNILLFSIKLRGHDLLLGFGLRGWLRFWRFFPWSFLALDLLLIVGLEWFLRKFDFAHKLPLLYLLAALLGLTFLVGTLLYRTPLNRILREEGEEHLPVPLRALYREAHHLPPPGSGVCRCKILSIQGNRLLVEDTRDGTSTLTIVLPADDSRATTSNLKIGDMVLIAGEEEDGLIQAFGLRKVLFR